MPFIMQIKALFVDEKILFPAKKAASRATA
jgi:hypothetical protein